MLQSMLRKHPVLQSIIPCCSQCSVRHRSGNQLQLYSQLLP